ncbi:garvicin Q family class II bacteriocin [Bombilactobacillus bombi]|uniref:garvicin Q family class II bacteriocin n=1 Tax=Bombilactobacillus bombi TaxID=1303590 RepID=UPI0015E62207|nr:garvicin Q family class II bacteriocin [Bombilactobacillus bombi]MBA1434313.1 bacteriocin [Bombilactobacillus bombi]
MLNYTELNSKKLEYIIGGSGPLFYGANGYLYRDKRGNYHYAVTKGPLEAALGVIANGWVSSAGGGYFNSHR